MNEVGYTINVGKLIYSNLSYNIRDTTSMGLGHPFLIYVLCVNADVRGDLDEEKLFPISVLPIK
ncbi:hypothetical protein IEQ34_001341 [Dendrobium chrysotoxum]|uniref:Uncharacterized protein n=1 Tax=Dendrobium chrysotoxum TaxID=161865 RepID=A0AAV7HNW8_DENCH|nr:hypothetical protein IEQ34_001341 [Dendrobium chrysotoxum]